MSNPRFPYRLIIETPLIDSNGSPIVDIDGNEQFQIVLNSPCGLRRMNESDMNSGIAQTDIKLSLEYTNVHIEKGYKATFYCGSVTISGKVTLFLPSNLGCNIYMHENG